MVQSEVLLIRIYELFENAEESSYDQKSKRIQKGDVDVSGLHFKHARAEWILVSACMATRDKQLKF